MGTTTVMGKAGLDDLVEFKPIVMGKLHIIDDIEKQKKYPKAEKVVFKGIFLVD